MGKTVKEIAKEMRNAVEEAILCGPMRQVHERIERALDDFEASIISFADDEALRRARLYYDQIKGLPDKLPNRDDNEPA